MHPPTVCVDLDRLFHLYSPVYCPISWKEAMSSARAAGRIHDQAVVAAQGGVGGTISGGVPELLRCGTWRWLMGIWGGLRME